MGIAVLPYTRELIPAVKDFNYRLHSRGVDPEYFLPEQEISPWLPKAGGNPVYEDIYTAVDDNGVRGGYILKTQDFMCGGAVLPIGYYHSPLSEGIVDRKYNTVGVQLLMDAMARQPLLFALGMGGYEEPLPRLLKAVRWSFFTVPFYFKVFHPAAFFRNIQALRKTKLRALALDLAAASGVGWAGVKALNWRSTRRPRRDTIVQKVRGFCTWADDLWERAGGKYAMCAVRDRKSLAALYPGRDPRFIRVHVSSRGRTLGWAVLLNTQMRRDKYFGDMRVGSIVDCFADPADAGAVIEGAARVLEELRADVAISNQSHAAWGAALRDAGFREGPSNFIFAGSPNLAGRLAPLEQTRTHIHLNRGDGDGPIHL